MGRNGPHQPQNNARSRGTRVEVRGPRESLGVLGCRRPESDFYRVIGAAERILAYAEDIGQQWLQGVGVARLLSQRRAKPKPA